MRGDRKESWQLSPKKGEKRSSLRLSAAKQHSSSKNILHLHFNSVSPVFPSETVLISNVQVFSFLHSD